MLNNRIIAKYYDYTIINLKRKDGERMPLFIKKRRPKDNPLINEINKTKIALEAAYSNFENVVDPDLIDSCIYEMNAVQNRYHFLLKQAKAADSTFC